MIRQTYKYRDPLGRTIYFDTLEDLKAHAIEGLELVAKSLRYQIEQIEGYKALIDEEGFDVLRSTTTPHFQGLRYQVDRLVYVADTKGDDMDGVEFLGNL